MLRALVTKMPQRAQRNSWLKNRSTGHRTPFRYVAQMDIEHSPSVRCLSSSLLPVGHLHTAASVRLKLPVGAKLFSSTGFFSSSSSSLPTHHNFSSLEMITSEIQETKIAIAKTESDIEELAQALKKLEHKIDNTTDLDEKKYLRDEKNRLLDKENRLLDEKNRLLDEKKQLRDKENLLLARLAEKEKQIAIAPLYDLSTPESIIESMKRVSERIPGLQFRTPEEMLKPNKLIPPHFQNFIDRDDALKNAISLLSKDIAHDQQRFKYPIVATAAGSGTGKTRFCDELAAKLTNPDNPSDEKILAIPISYNGFTDQKFSDNSSNELALRILFMSFFSFSGPDLAGDWGTFGSLFQTSTRSLDGCTIIDAIFQYSGASRAVLLIDEISKSPNESATLNYAEALVNGNSGRTQTLRLFITELDARFQRSSSRPIDFIQLYLLQNEHVMTHLFPGSTPLQQILIKLACGHPRLLEEIDRYFKANEHNPPTSLATSLANINYNRLKFLSSLSQVRVALLGGQTTSNESLGLLRESIFMDPDRQSDLYLGEAPYSPQMPLLPLLQWTHRHSNEPTFEIIYRMITTLTDQINLTTNSGPGGKPYEVFHALWEVMVRQ